MSFSKHKYVLTLDTEFTYIGFYKLTNFSTLDEISNNLEATGIQFRWSIDFSDIPCYNQFYFKNLEDLMYFKLVYENVIK